jgi:hypothetical protein
MKIRKSKFNLLFTESSLSAFFYIISILIPSVLSAQGSGQQSARANLISPAFGSIEEYIESNQEQPYEKIFLHTDHQTYMQNDTIWFKAYLWYGQEQQPDTASGILHVDLINTEGKVMMKRRLLIDNGCSHGDFSLDTTIAPGSYFIRSYTRLMQNLNSGEPYYLPVTINSLNQNFQFECSPVLIKQTRNDSLRIGFKFAEIDQKGDLNKNTRHYINYTLKIGKTTLKKDSVFLANTSEHALRYSLNEYGDTDSIAEFEVSIHDKGLSFNKSFQIPLHDNIDLQFFPEGGDLVNGLKSKVAFKAIGLDGLGREIEGEIMMANDSLVTHFKSSDKGMGVFTLQPSAKTKYSAHFWYNKQKYIVPLPNVLSQGSTISVSPSVSPTLTIKQMPVGVISSKYVIGSSYGKIWFSALIKSLRDSAQLQIPVDLIPEGVCRLTVLDAGFKPECERLIYVDKNQRFKIEIIPDSLSYSKRSKVTLRIKATDPKGVPVKADMSLAVLDRDQSPDNVKTAGIKAYKLINSELKGHIEDPDSYFINDSCINKPGLDLLLLTHGYRKFTSNSKTFTGQILSPEKSIYVSGKINFKGTKLQEKNLNYQDIGLTLISVSDKPILEVGHPDSAGLFNFQIPLMSGKQRLMVQARKPNNKPFNGDILIDSPLKPPVFTTLPDLSNNMSFPKMEYINRIQAVKKTDLSRMNLAGSMSKTLSEVVVTAKADAKNWWRNYDKDARKIADLDSLDPSGDTYLNINDLLVKEFGARWYNNESANMNTVLLPCIRLMGGGMNFWFPIYLVDGTLYWNGKDFDFSRLNPMSAFPVNEIKRILVIPPGKSIVTNYAYGPIIGFPHFILQSMVIIETYSKKTYRGDIPGVKKFIIDGLDAPRSFYSPGYDAMKNNKEYDGRSTIFWDPSILTDENGQAKIEFFTTDRITRLETIINGMESESGNPGEGSVQIQIRR